MSSYQQQHDVETLEFLAFEIEVFAAAEVYKNLPNAQERRRYLQAAQANRG